MRECIIQMSGEEQGEGTARAKTQRQEHASLVQRELGDLVTGVDELGGKWEKTRSENRSPIWESLAGR